jgi:hypothetical protein
MQSLLAEISAAQAPLPQDWPTLQQANYRKDLPHDDRNSFVSRKTI